MRNVIKYTNWARRTRCALRGSGAFCYYWYVTLLCDVGLWPCDLDLWSL